MSKNLKTRTQRALELALVFMPWLASMYMLYAFEKYEIWVPETAHRDKITIVILVVGMGLSFLLHTYFSKKKRILI